MMTVDACVTSLVSTNEADMCCTSAECRCTDDNLVKTYNTALHAECTGNILAYSFDSSIAVPSICRC